MPLEREKRIECKNFLYQTISIFLVLYLTSKLDTEAFRTLKTMQQDQKIGQGTQDNTIFIPDDEDPNLHIIDTLIRERCPSLETHWTWPITRPILYSMLGYRMAVKVADQMQGMNGAESFDLLCEILELNLEFKGSERLPKTGMVIVASNHPTGLADGAAVWAAMRSVREDVMFYANADAIRINHGFDDVIIPVEWVLEKRSTEKTKETLRRTKLAIEKETCLIIFPSGKLAKMVKGVLTEQEWMPTVVSLAKKNKIPILPLHVGAKNSKLFYFLSHIHPEMRNITLFNELLNKKKTKFAVQAGKLIYPEQLAGDIREVNSKLQKFVSCTIVENPDEEFKA